MRELQVYSSNKEIKTWLEFTKTMCESQILQIVNFSTKHSDVKKYIALYILKFMIFFYKEKFFFTKNFLYKKISR